MYYSALIGNPTEHSISHVMFEEMAKMARISEPYKHIKINVDADEIENTLQALRILKFVGINVTLPHKLDVIQYLDKVDNSARFIGAVNTIKIGTVLNGYNTDWVGIYKPLQKYERQIKSVAILGSGGAARAAIYAAHKLKAKKVYMFYRESDNDAKTADLLARSAELNIIPKQYADIRGVFGEVDLIVNATSAGMIGKDRLPISLQDIADIGINNKIYFDVVFNPVETPLLLHFRNSGAVTIDGLWMMLYQGIAALEIWLDTSIHISTNDLTWLHDQLVKELAKGV